MRKLITANVVGKGNLYRFEAVSCAACGRKVKRQSFVPMLVDTMASPAWRAMSPYARVVYIALRSRYGHKIRNNGRVWLAKLRSGEKQNPVTTITTDCHDHNDIPVSRPSRQSPEIVSRPTRHISEQACHDPRDISRVNHLDVPSVAHSASMLPPGVTADAIPTWVLMLPPDMAAMATVAWFYGSLPKMAAAA